MLSTDLVLHFEGLGMRIFGRDGLPWFMLSDACAGLNIKQPAAVLRRLDDDEKGVILSHTLGGPQKVTIVSLAGLASVIVRSKDAVTPGTLAYRFRRWLMHDVVPAIFQYGQFPPPKALESSQLPKLEPVHSPEGSTATQRFFEEVDRMAAVMRTTPEKVLKVLTSPQTVRMMRLHGEGLSSILKKADKVEAMGSAGFDLKYILRGERTMTRDERALISQLRRIDSSERAATFHRFAGQLPALAAPSADEIEDA